MSNERIIVERTDKLGGSVIIKNGVFEGQIASGYAKEILTIDLYKRIYPILAEDKVDIVYKTKEEEAEKTYLDNVSVHCRAFPMYGKDRVGYTSCTDTIKLSDKNAEEKMIISVIRNIVEGLVSDARSFLYSEPKTVEYWTIDSLSFLPKKFLENDEIMQQFKQRFSDSLDAKKAMAVNDSMGQEYIDAYLKQWDIYKGIVNSTMDRLNIDSKRPYIKGNATQATAVNN